MAAYQSSTPTALLDLWGQLGVALRSAITEELKTLTGTRMASPILDLVEARFGELITSEPARRLIEGHGAARLPSSTSSILDISLDTTTASIRRHLNAIDLGEKEDDEIEEEEEHSVALLDTSVFPAAPPSPDHPDEAIVEDNVEVMHEEAGLETSMRTADPPSPGRTEDVVVDEDMSIVEQARLDPLDASMVSAAGRRSSVHPGDVTMHEDRVALLDSTMLDAGRLSPADLVENTDVSMVHEESTVGDTDEPMPYARRYIKAHRRLATRAKEAEPMEVQEQALAEDPKGEAEDPAEEANDPEGEAVDAAEEAVDPKGEVVDPEDPEEALADDPKGEAEDPAEEANDPEGEAVDAAEEAVDPKGEVVDPEDPEELEMEVQPLVAPPSPKPARRILTAARGITLTRAAAMLSPIAQPSVHDRSPDHHRDISPPAAHFDDFVDVHSMPAATPSPHRRPSDTEEHACTPVKRARLAIAALAHELEEAQEEARRANLRSTRSDLLLHDEWEARIGAREDTYRLVDEIAALEAELDAERARTLAAQQAAVVIAAAAAVAQAVAQPAVPAAVAPAAVAPAPAAPNAVFAAEMAAVKARLLAYLAAPGNQVKIRGVANPRLSTAWHSLATTLGKRLKELRDAASTGAARITPSTVADPNHTQQLTEFKDESERMCDEFDALLARVEAYGRKIVNEHAATRRAVRWTQIGYGVDYDAIKAMAKDNLRTLKGFRESCRALPLPL